MLNRVIHPLSISPNGLPVHHQDMPQYLRKWTHYFLGKCKRSESCDCWCACLWTVGSLQKELLCHLQTINWCMTVIKRQSASLVVGTTFRLLSQQLSGITMQQLYQHEDAAKNRGCCKHRARVKSTAMELQCGDLQTYNCTSHVPCPLCSPSSSSPLPPAASSGCPLVCAAARPGRHRPLPVVDNPPPACAGPPPLSSADLEAFTKPGTTHQNIFFVVARYQNIWIRSISPSSAVSHSNSNMINLHFFLKIPAIATFFFFLSLNMQTVQALDTLRVDMK